MYDFGKVNSATNLSPEWILSRIDEFTIFRFYFGEFKVGKRYPSKFRKDNNPSTGFYISKGGRLIYNDLTNNEKVNCFGFVQKLCMCSFYEGLNKIASDFGLINENSKIVTQDFLDSSAKEEKVYKQDNLIQFSYQPFTEEAIKFWRYYEITKEELVKNNVFLIKDLYLNKIKIYNPENHLRFAYPLSYKDEEGKIQNSVKVYSPKDIRMKWLSTIPNSIPFGYDQLPHLSDTVIITKSKKDEIVLKKLFTDVFSVQNESENSFTEDRQQQILKDYKRRIIVFDNDDPGVNACIKFNQKGFDYFNIPKKYLEHKIKDPSDFIKAFGEDYLREIFKQKNICPTIK